MADINNLCITINQENLSFKTDGIDLTVGIPEISFEQELFSDIGLLESFFEEGSPGDKKLKIAIQLGEHLFRLLFHSPELLTLYHSKRDTADKLRLILEFDFKEENPNQVVSKWASFPWEYIRDPDPERGGFIALRADCHIIRRFNIGIKNKIQTIPHLQVLALFAEPHDQQYYNREELIRSTVNKLSQIQVQARIVPQPTLPALIQAIGDYKPNVLHIVAHGNYIPGSGGCLAFEDDFGNTNIVLSTDLANELKGSGIQLVLLMSCLSGAGEGVTKFDGVAHAILKAGIPTVVAMQYSVPVITASQISLTVYHALSRGSLLDDVIAEVRRTLRGGAFPNRMDWVIPVLYSQGEMWNFAKIQEQVGNVKVERLLARNNLTSISHLRPIHLFGRGKELVQIAEAIREPLQRRRFVNVTGLGGIGKTAAVIESAFWHWERNYFPDGVFGFSTNGMTYLQLLNSLGQAFGLSEFGKLTQQDQEKTILSYLEQQKILIVIDNVDGLRDDASFRRLLEKLSPTPTGRLLITCRRRIDVDGEKEVTLLPIPIDDAVSLFLYFWELDNPTDEQKKETSEICGPIILGCHSLAVVIAGSLARKEHLTSLLSLKNRLSESISKTLKNRKTPVEEVSIFASLEVSYNILGDTSKKMLARVAIFYGSFREEAVNMISSDFPDWRQGLIELMEHKFLDKSEIAIPNGNKLEVFTLHPVIRSYGQDKIEDKKNLHLKAGRFLVNTGYANEIVEGVLHLEAGEAWKEIIQAIWKVESYLELRGLWAEDKLVLEAGLRAVRADNDKQKEGDILNMLGSNHWRMGNSRAAIEYFEQALIIYRDVGDKKGQGGCFGNLGLAYTTLGERDKAIEQYEKSLIISKEMGDKKMEANALHNLGNTKANFGDMNKAIEYFDQSLLLYKEIGDRRGQASLLGNLGNTCNTISEFKKAISYYEQALAIARKIGDRQIEGNHLGNMGLAYAALGDVKKAVECYKQSLTIAKEIGDLKSEGSRFSNLGNACEIISEFKEAIKYYQLAFDIAKETGNKQGEGICLNNIGNAYISLGNVNEAIEKYEQALTISRKINDRRIEANALSNLGLCKYRLNEVPKAIEYYEKALIIDREIGDRVGESGALGNLGNAYAKLGDTNRAIEYYEHALDVARVIGDRRGEGSNFGNLGTAYYKLGSVNKSIEYYQGALAIAKAIGDRRGEGSCLGNLGLAYTNLGNYEISLRFSVQGFLILKRIESPDAQLIWSNIIELRSKLGEQKFNDLLQHINREFGYNFNIK